MSTPKTKITKKQMKSVKAGKAVVSKNLSDSVRNSVNNVHSIRDSVRG
jgi:hypothetical protein